MESMPTFEALLSEEIPILGLTVNPSQADYCPTRALCPRNQVRGEAVPLITLKSLLQPAALAQLNAHQNYRFCPSADCPVVYFGETDAQTFTTDQLKVLVFAKDSRPEVPVCYCFGWQRGQIHLDNQRQIMDEIRAHIEAKRCGCEVNNPQGRCCLANVQSIT
jgi:hypothetical protein